MKVVFLGVGTNLGDREANLKEALAGIGKYIGRVINSSSVYETEPWGFNAEQQFLNIVVKVETALIPSEVLESILTLEKSLGRVRSENQYSSRVIDIDILFYGDEIINSEELKIPHPLLHKRKFVLVPLCEIEPELVHPVLKTSLKSLLEQCEDKSEVRKVTLAKRSL
jgi:2-amino-4-hydroxy-6-hydroxymethyldihydropteridine diphosphokinase